MWTETNTQEQLIEGILRHGPDILEYCQTSSDLTQYLNRLNEEHLNYPTPKQSIDPTNWFIPYEYKTMDILDWLYQRCPTPEIRARVVEELRLFAKHDMIPMLKAMKYIVDTLRANNVVWGVGRGSSVASYVLHIIGVHKIDSIKYNIPIDEFFKGEQNG
jgi:DNA polymerase III alpha subunit